MSRYYFTIQGQLPGLNDYINALNISKFKGAEMKRKSEQSISSFIKKELKNVKIDNPVQIELWWVEPNRKRDKDNIAFAKKFIFDALVKNGILQNDTWDRIEGFSDKFIVDIRNPRIEVIIIENLEN